MTSPRCAVIVILAATVLGACGGSDDGEVVDAVETAPTTTVDLADGAFIRNESVVLDGDGVPVTTQTTVAPDSTTPVTSAPGSDASTVTTTSGDTAGDTGAASTGGSTGGAAVGPQQGLVVIDGVSYAFETSVCEVASDEAQIVGRGTTSDGKSFEASIFFEVDDIDDDGSPDRVFEIFVDPEGVTGSDAVPSFFASNFDVLGDGSSGSLNFEIVGQRITGTGSIVDFNGVAFPADRPGPLTLDANCA